MLVLFSAGFLSLTPMRVPIPLNPVSQPDDERYLQYSEVTWDAIRNRRALKKLP